jgi:uncharacterized protein
MNQKYKILKEILSSYESLIVAYSGGVDSTFLLKLAYEVLGSNITAISIATPYIDSSEIEDAKRIAKEIGVKHVVIKKPWLEDIRNNPKNRCYLCKHSILSSIKVYAKEHGISVVAEGSNIDDTKEHRPGRKAVEELEIATPLLDAKLSKKEIRTLSQKLNLSTWDKPSKPCLLTRFSYDTLVEEDTLNMVENAEKYLITMGYKDMRVRYEHKLARIEMPNKIQNNFLNEQSLRTTCRYFKSLGFLHVTLDLESYRHDSIAESILMGA